MLSLTLASQSSALESPNFDLHFSEYCFTFKVVDSITLPEYTGSMWRGAFGTALEALVCCGQSPHTSRCVYSQLFEPEKNHFAIKDSLAKNYRNLPVPYVFKVYASPGRKLLKGEAFSVRLLLIGWANSYLRQVIQAMQHAGTVGLGKGKGTALLETVVQQSAVGQKHLVFSDKIHYQIAAPACPPIPQTHTNARIQLLTPLNLGDGGHNFEIPRFLMGVVRRIALVQGLYCDKELETNFAFLKHQAAQVRGRFELNSEGWQRYSSRQQKHQPLRGWTGCILLQGEALRYFWPYLYLGQWLHTGKMTGMGLGQYQLQTIDWA